MVSEFASVTRDTGSGSDRGDVERWRRVILIPSVGAVIHSTRTVGCRPVLGTSDKEGRKIQFLPSGTP